ncbi:DUF159-domain-containing protein [Xylariomycetidae sp. FL2044]|nr:DUF159-domain-containing protein [Xylariomycetidae sp. FL2044]
MCGRYALALRPGQVREMMQEDAMPVDDAPDDDDLDNPGAPRQSYNFAPGYHGIVYRADVPDWGAGPRRQHGKKSSGGGRDDDNDVAAEEAAEANAEGEETGGKGDVHYKLQSMKWGLVPFWTKRNPGYGSLMKTINCRDDSLAQSGGMWSSMKARKRCLVVAQGFYEWLKKDGGREKLPHFVKRKDGKLMCFAGLWDVVKYEDDDELQKHYTYTIITTDSNKQLKFLHERMPVILENGSEDVHKWLDPKRHEWSPELQSLLRSYEGELEVYPVSKDVGKVGNNSPTFIVPIDSKENKSNIANFFAKGGGASKTGTPGTAKKEKAAAGKLQAEKEETGERQPEIGIKEDEGFVAMEGQHDEKTKGDESPAAHHDTRGVKRDAEDGKKDNNDDDSDTQTEIAKPSPAKKKPRVPPTRSSMTTRSAAQQNTELASPPMGPSPRQKISATSNGTRRSPAKANNNNKEAGTQKITKFFGNST